MKRGYKNPTTHVKDMGINPPDNRAHAGDYSWDTSTIVHMLARQEYLGHTVNFITYRKSYKQKKQVKNDPSEWQFFENTHGAIKEPVFEVVQKIRGSRHRWAKCRFSLECFSAQITEPSCTRYGIAAGSTTRKISSALPAAGSKAAAGSDWFQHETLRFSHQLDFPLGLKQAV
jgi:hypothetical protein